MPRNPQEREIAFQCLQLALGQGPSHPDNIIGEAERYFAFVTGDDAADKLKAVREAVS